MEETINIKKIKPMFTKILVTKNMYHEAVYVPGTMIIDPTKSKQGVKEWQTVVAVGDAVRDIKVGDVVCINPMNYAVKKYAKTDMHDHMEEYSNQVTSYAFPEIEIDGVPHLYIDSRDVDFIIEEFEPVTIEVVSDETV